MLTHIHINHFITIDDLHLDFLSGTTVITGETGAGKSLLIDAIELALGGRITTNLIFPGYEKAEISLCFDIKKLPSVNQWLKKYDLDNDHNECILRRIIHQDGRSKCFINGIPTTLQPLRELSEQLVQIHGQHEHQSLLKTNKQREILDQYANHQPLVDQVRALSDEWQAIHQEIIQLNHTATTRKARADFLQYQLQELQTLDLKQDESQTLDLEHKQLSHADALRQHLSQAMIFLTQHEEYHALHFLNHALQALEQVREVDPKIVAWIDTLKATLVYVNDIEDEITRYLDTIDLDPKRLQWVDNRLMTLFDAARKYKVEPHALLEFQHTLSEEYNTLNTSDTRLTELTEKLTLLEKKYYEKAKELSASRKHHATLLSKQIMHLIHQLSLPHAEFHIVFEKDDTSIAPHGLEKIIFQITTNPGQPLQPLAKIVSGGELSRIGLAIHIATAGLHADNILIFDEIDVGIGGGTAEIVGKLLRQLGQSHQILCITHHPQVASRAHHHFRVSKVQKKNQTSTHFQSLSAKDKIHEIARMLGGVEITQKTIEHARELVEEHSA